MLLSASLHRSWYAPGDVVRVEVSLHVPPNPPGSVPNSLAMLFGRANNDFTETDTDAPPVIHVKSLMACVVGVCVVDSKRLQYALEGDKQMTEHFQMLVADNLSKGHNAYRLFCSEEFSLVSHLPLREKESRALVVSFTLPGYLPPSFRGQCIQFYYALHLHGTRCGPQESTARVKLRVPIKVFSAQAVVTPLLLPLSFPLDKFDFGERVVMRQPVPSPALTGPLESYLVPSEVEDFHANSLSRISLHRLMSQLSRQRTPLEFPLSLNGELALTVAVASTTVMIGDSLNGVFTVNSNLKSYPVKVHGNLEFLECCSSKHVRKETSCHQLPGWGKELVVAQTMLKKEFEWAIIDRASVHFFIPFTNPNTYASMHTDVVTTFWQLRLRFLWCKPSVLRQCRERRSGELMLEEEPELVIPLTVVPPAHCKEKSCKGSMVQETPPSFPFEDDLPLLILRSSGKTIAVTKDEPAVQSFLPFSLKACDVVRVTSKDALRQAHEDGYCSVVSKEWLIQVKVKVSLDPVREGTHWALLLDSCCGNGNGKEKVYMNSLSTAKRFKGTEDELRGVGVWLKSFQLGGSCELYLASEPSISDLCITKEIGRLRLHKEEDMGVNEQVFFGDTMDDIASLVETFLDSFFSNGLTAPKAIFWPSLLTYPLNIHYGEDKLRVAEHRAALLPMRRLLHLGQHIKEWPLTRKNVATMTTHVVPRTGKLWEKHLIRNIHTNLTPSSVINGSESFLVSGSYDYYHYRVDEFRDDGWGCAYRSLQTLLSWFQYEGLMNEPMPDIRKIQEILSLKDPEKMNRKEFVGSKDWIGSFEVMIVIQHFLPGLECTIRRMERGSDLDTDPSVQQLLVGHFRQRRASPVMIGGSSYAHTIIGVEANLGTMEARYLIADPHYSSGETNVKTILKKGYVGWKEAGKFFEANSWYNLCIPQLSSYDPR